MRKTTKAQWGVHLVLYNCPARGPSARPASLPAPSHPHPYCKLAGGAGPTDRLGQARPAGTDGEVVAVWLPICPNIERQGCLLTAGCLAPPAVVKRCAFPGGCARCASAPCLTNDTLKASEAHSARGSRRSKLCTVQFGQPTHALCGTYLTPRVSGRLSACLSPRWRERAHKARQRRPLALPSCSVIILLTDGCVFVSTRASCVFMCVCACACGRHKLAVSSSIKTSTFPSPPLPSAAVFLRVQPALATAPRKQRGGICDETGRGVASSRATRGSVTVGHVGQPDSRHRKSKRDHQSLGKTCGAANFYLRSTEVLCPAAATVVYVRGGL